MMIERPLTEVELELMNIIWGFDHCTVKDVQKAIAVSRDLAYTSVATMMKILEGKGILKSQKNDKAHIYHALISKMDYESLSLKHLAKNLFGGDQTSMVMRLLDESDLTSDELHAIKTLLDQRIHQ